MIRRLQEIAAGDRDSFTRYYRANNNLVFGVLLRILQDRADAEEVLQDVFIRVWTRAGRYDPALANPQTWLIAIARHAAIDRLRARGSRPVTGALSPDLPGHGPSPEAQAVASDEAARLTHCLSLLADDKARAVRDAYLEGWSYDELARRAGVPLNTMKTWLRRSLLRLRLCLDQTEDRP